MSGVLLLIIAASLIFNVRYNLFGNSEDDIYLGIISDFLFANWIRKAKAEQLLTSISSVDRERRGLKVAEAAGSLS